MPLQRNIKHQRIDGGLSNDTIRSWPPPLEEYVVVISGVMTVNTSQTPLYMQFFPILSFLPGGETGFKAYCNLTVKLRVIID